MHFILKEWTPRWHGSEGSTAAEYALLIGLIAGSIVIALVAFGGMTLGLFEQFINALG